MDQRDEADDWLLIETGVRLRAPISRLGRRWIITEQEAPSTNRCSTHVEDRLEARTWHYEYLGSVGFGGEDVLTASALLLCKRSVPYLDTFDRPPGHDPLG